jgi:[ribosomal protein S5]-alanine N-acetyltransferase
MSRRIPVLETGRLIIRELTMDDLDSINNILNHANGSNITVSERQAWLQWTVLGYEMFAMLEQPHYGERAIALKDTGELIGAVGIVPYIDTFNRIPAFHRAEGSPASAEVGLYWAIDPAYQRQGYASEAARIVMDYLFNHEKLGRIIATTGYDNVASQKVMQKLGMTVYQLEEPQPPDQFVVAVIENKTYHQEESL